MLLLRHHPTTPAFLEKKKYLWVWGLFFSWVYTAVAPQHCTGWPLKNIHQSLRLSICITEYHRHLVCISYDLLKDIH